MFPLTPGLPCELSVHLLTLIHRDTGSPVAFPSKAGIPLTTCTLLIKVREACFFSLLPNVTQISFLKSLVIGQSFLLLHWRLGTWLIVSLFVLLSSSFSSTQHPGYSNSTTLLFFLNCPLHISCLHSPPFRYLWFPGPSLRKATLLLLYPPALLRV